MRPNKDMKAYNEGSPNRGPLNTFMTYAKQALVAWLACSRFEIDTSGSRF